MHFSDCQNNNLAEISALVENALMIMDEYEKLADFVINVSESLNPSFKRH